MQIITDVSKVLKTVQRNFIFLLNVLWESSIHFILVYSHKMVFIRNVAALLYVTMRERARTSTSSYNLVHNLLIYLLPLKSWVFVVHFSNTFWHGNKAFTKGSSLKLFHSLLSFTCHIVNVGVWKFVFTCAVIKIKISHSCHTRVVLVAPVSHSCRSRSTRVALVSH